MTKLKVLTVGDGDLSFSLALARCYGKQIDITATTLIPSKDELLQTYASASDILSELENHHQVSILFDIDATKLDSIFQHDTFSTHDNGSTSYNEETEVFDIVMFNHPHLGFADLMNEDKHAQRHHCLISHYLHSAKLILSKQGGGTVHLCLCGEQPTTWKVDDAAKRCGLTMIYSSSTSEPFHPVLLAGKTQTFIQDDDYHNGNVVSNSKNDDRSFEKQMTLLKPQLVQQGWKAPRRYRNGRLGSRHWLGRYGYIHRRTHGDHHVGNGKDMNVMNSINLVYSASPSDSCNKSKQFLKEIPLPNKSLRLDCLSSNDDSYSYECPICELHLPTKDAFHHHLDKPAFPDPIFQSKYNTTNGKTNSIKTFHSKYALETFQKQYHRNDHKHDSIAHLITTVEQNQTNNTPICETPTYKYDISQQNDHKSNSHHEKLKRKRTRIAMVQVEGKRLRWWARQPDSFGNDPQITFHPKKGPMQSNASTSIIKSKKHCEHLIKNGALSVNGKQVLDSSRILHIGDEVQWTIMDDETPPISSSTPTSSTSSSTTSIICQTDATTNSNMIVKWDTTISSLAHVHIVKQINDSYYVIWKPVGFRACGTFSDRSVESILSQRFHKTITCLTRLEIGCSGLCLIAVQIQNHSLKQQSMKSQNKTSTSKSQNNNNDNNNDGGDDEKKQTKTNPMNSSISYTFVALVHGTPPNEWREGIDFELSTGGERRWRHKHITNHDDCRSSLLSFQTIQNDKAKNIYHETNSIQSHPENQNQKNHWDPKPAHVHVELLESLIFDKGNGNDNTNVTISTLRLTCDEPDGRLCNRFCYFLRKCNYPVVGDRFCKRELALLPRSCRSIMKSKLHIGCFGIKAQNLCLPYRTEKVNFDVQTPLPERLQASYWIRKNE